MEAVVEAFRYSSQPLGSTQIRLIDLQPGARNQPLECSLMVVDRSEAEYVALSYAWGDVTPTRAIQVDDKDFWIHTNLHEALIHVRDESDPLRIWTDKICINQEDTAERNKQVRMMGQTYANAVGILIWLGPSPPDRHVLSDFREFPTAHPTMSDDELLRAWESVCDVVTRPYFQRLWVFQEFVLARNGIVILGDESCDFSVLWEYGTMWDLDGKAPIWQRVGAAAFRQDVPRTEFIQKLTAFTHASQKLMGMCSLRALAKRVSSGKEECSQEKLLGFVARQKCYDPRDYVFGTTGIAEHIGLKCDIVDYNMTASEVFTRHAKRALLSDISYLAEPRDHTLGEIELPSWAIDLSREPQGVGFLFLLGGKYEAGGQNPRLALTEASFSEGDQCLSLPGFALDEIQVIVHRWGSASSLEHHWHAVANTPWVEIEKQLVEPFEPPSPYGEYQGRLQAFWRTLVGNARSSPMTEWEPWPSNDGGAEYEVFVNRATPLGKTRAESVLRFQSTLAAAISNTALVRTRRGYFGLVPDNSRHGDRIIVVPGFGTPLVLQKESEGQKWFLRGLAYVHGMMSGEFADEMLSQNLSPQVFKIY